MLSTEKIGESSWSGLTKYALFQVAAKPTEKALYELTKKSGITILGNNTSWAAIWDMAKQNEIDPRLISCIFYVWPNGKTS